VCLRVLVSWFSCRLQRLERDRNGGFEHDARLEPQRPCRCVLLRFRFVSWLERNSLLD
jgi:hypothetical protein